MSKKTYIDGFLKVAAAMAGVHPGGVVMPSEEDVSKTRDFINSGLGHMSDFGKKMDAFTKRPDVHEAIADVYGNAKNVSDEYRERIKRIMDYARKGVQKRQAKKIEPTARQIFDRLRKGPYSSLENAVNAAR